MSSPIHISFDAKLRQITLTSDKQEDAPVLTVEAEQLAHLINAIGMIQQQMRAGTTPPSMEGVRFTPVRQTRWVLQPDDGSDGSILAFQHPAFGPVGMVLTSSDADRLAEGLMLHHKLNHAQRPDPNKMN